jgi:hypothetical protein
MHRNIHDGTIVEKLPSVIALGGVIDHPTPEQYVAAGWREIVPDARAVPAGQRIAAVAFEPEGDKVREVVTFEPIPAPPDPLAGFEGAYAEFAALAESAKVKPGPGMMAEMVVAAKAQPVANRMIALRLDLAPVWPAVLAAMAAAEVGR